MSGTIVARAPATSANLGAGFDCAAVALELWNELHVSSSDGPEPRVSIEGEGADEVPCGPDHLALRAFALVAPLAGHDFHFVNRIPLERGLGSSAAILAAGLVAGCAVSGHELSADRLLELGLPLEGHSDNLAAALRGGVCLSWADGGATHSRQIALELPLAAIVVVPDVRVNTGQSRSRLPEFLRHHEAVEAAASAALLGAAIAAGDAELLAASFHDQLHEPFRIAEAPVLQELRARPLAGAAGSTLSGSGPSVIVWALPEQAAAVASELEQRFPEARVLRLAVAAQGAHARPEPQSGQPLTTTTTLGAPV